MTSSNGNIFRVTGHLCEEFTGHRWIPRIMANDAELLMFSLICTWLHGWVNNHEAGDLRRHYAHYDVTVMITFQPVSCNSISHHSSTLKYHKLLKFTLKYVKSSHTAYNQYHGCWWLGDIRSQGISSYDIDKVIPEYFSLKGPCAQIEILQEKTVNTLDYIANTIERILNTNEPILTPRVFSNVEGFKKYFTIFTFLHMWAYVPSYKIAKIDFPINVYQTYSFKSTKVHIGPEVQTITRNIIFKAWHWKWIIYIYMIYIIHIYIQQELYRFSMGCHTLSPAPVWIRIPGP